MRKTALTLLAATSLWSSAFAQSAFIDTVTITAPDPNASEAGPDPGMFEIRRSGPTNYSLYVFYRLSGTASNGVDYEGIAESVVIPQGSFTASITVKPIDDMLVEGPETVVLQIFPSPLLCPSPACGYDIGWPSNATVIIADNDRTSRPGEVNIYATDPVATEQPATTANAPDTATFTVRRSDGTNEGIVVYYEISGAASNGVDYQKLSGQVAIPEGALSADIVVTPIDDDLVEGNETVVLTLLAPCPQCLFATPPCEVPQETNCYPIGPHNQATVTIVDNDRNPATNHPPFVQLNAPQDGQQFIAPANIELRAFSQDPEDSYYVTVEFFEGTKSLGFGTFAPTRCAIPYCPYFYLTWSNVPPGDYVLTAKATDLQGASSVSAPAHVTVVADNRPPEVNIYATDPIATEEPATTAHAPDTATFTVRRSGGTNESLAVYYAIGGSASNGEDYQKLSGNVTIPEGAWSADIVVVPIDDLIAEGTETVELTVLPVCPDCLWANPPCLVVQTTTCYRVGIDSKAVAYIRDNDQSNGPTVVSIVATDPIAVEGQFCASNWWWTSSGSSAGWQTNSVIRPTNSCPGSNTATVVVRRSGDTSSDLTVYYRVGGTASNGIDYVTLPGKVTIATGHRAAQIEVIPIDDSIAERIETVLLTLQPPPPGPSAYLIGSPSRAAAIILDNDQPRPPCRRLSDGMFHLCMPGTNGFTFCVHTSPDLINWTAVCTNVVTEGAVHFVDPDAADLPHRFYRVMPDPNYSPAQ